MAKATHRGWHEGTRYRRKDGLYIGRVRFEGKRHQVTSADAKERDRLLRQLIRDLEEGKQPQAAPRRWTLEQVVRAWLDEQEVAHPATYPTWKSYAESHLTGSVLAPARCGALTTAAITALYREKLAAGYAQNTVRQLHRTLRACLNWAVGQGVPVPVAVLKMGAPAVETVEYTQLTPAQVGQLFRSARAAGDDLEALWRLMWYASPRPGEMLVLTWQYCGLGGLPQIEIRRILVRVVDGEPVTRAGKNRGSLSVMAIPPDAVDALRRHWAAQEARRGALIQSGGRWIEPAIGRLVFDRGDGGAMRHEQAEEAFYRALKRAGLPKCRLHDLRGASLSALRDAGHDVLDVQRRARHASVRTTMESYIRVSNEADRRAAETLERLVTETNGDTDLTHSQPSGRPIRTRKTPTKGAG